MLPLKSLCTRSQLLMTKDTEWTILINRCNCGWEHIKWLLLTAWITDCTCSFYFFDGCILLFLKVLFSFLLFFFHIVGCHCFLWITRFQKQSLTKLSFFNTPRVETLVAVTSLLVMLYQIFMSGRTVAQSQKDQTDLELIKRSITRLWISFNFLIIRLIVWAKISFSCPPTPPSSSTLSSPAPPPRPRPQTPSALIYFVSPFTLQKLVSLAALPFLISLIFRYPFPPPPPLISVHLLIKSSTCRVMFVGTQLHYNPSVYHLHGFMVPVPEAAVTMEQRGPPACSVSVCARAFWCYL